MSALYIPCAEVHYQFPKASGGRAADTHAGYEADLVLAAEKLPGIERFKVCSLRSDANACQPP